MVPHFLAALLARWSYSLRYVYGDSDTQCAAGVRKVCLPNIFTTMPRNCADFASHQHGGDVVYVSPNPKTLQGYPPANCSSLTFLLCHFFSGGAVEESHGLLNGMFFFFVPGIGANILSSVFLPQYISVGASGGIFGLIGGCIADITLNWKLLFISGADQDSTASKRNCAAVLGLVVEIVVNLCLGLSPFG
jgi:hypothetical protein